MKKSLLALAALTAFAGAASAQSSVTLFGILDMALTSQTNGSAGTVKSLSTDGINSNRIGFRGIEDLGGGLRAGFWIEGGFGPDTGCGGGSVGTPATCAGQTWQRRSTVSLIGNFGEVRLGRDYTPTFNNFAAFDPFGYNGPATVGNLRSSLSSTATTLVRANNTVAYFLPSTIGGLYGQAQIAASEGVAGQGNKNLSGRLGYAAGPINVGFAYAKNSAVGTMIDDFKTMNIGASYDFGVVKIGAIYEKNDYSVNSQKISTINAQAPLGQGLFKIMVARSTGSSDNYSANMFGIGYVYDLSKRTALYTQYARVSNGGNASVGGSFQAAAGGNANAGFLKGETSSAYQFGVRHSF